MNCFKFDRKPETKCVISAVDMWSDKTKSDDKVNFYIYDKKKYASKIWRRNMKHAVEDEVPIGSANYCHVNASYITFGSLLFRIGGKYLSYTDREDLQKKIDAIPHRWGPDGYERLLCELSRGKRSATKTVDIIDLNSNDDLMVAIEGPKMSCPRLLPHLLILQGNLYVAGGFADTDLHRKHFMEVLKKPAAAINAWFWEAVPNPPPYCDLPSDKLPNGAITGAVESNGVIIVGFDDKAGGYGFYTYQPTTKIWNVWKTFANMIPIHLNTRSLYLKRLTWRSAVVSDKYMLWLPRGLTRPTLYVMDLGNESLVTIDLSDKKVLLQKDTSEYPILLKLKEWEFGIFWKECEKGGPEYSSSLDTYVGLHVFRFTLKVKKDGTLDVKPKKPFFSLIPSKSTGLVDVCIADVPDSKRHNKQWTTFC